MWRKKAKMRKNFIILDETAEDEKYFSSIWRKEARTRNNFHQFGRKRCGGEIIFINLEGRGEDENPGWVGRAARHI
jgi:hypothetical protein